MPAWSSCHNGDWRTDVATCPPVPVIQLNTRIRAPIRRCFDLDRSVDLHLLSTRDTGEQAVAGVTHGLMRRFLAERYRILKQVAEQ